MYRDTKAAIYRYIQILYRYISTRRGKLGSITRRNASHPVYTQFVSDNIYLKRGKTLNPYLGKMKAYIEAHPLQFMQGQTTFPRLTVLMHVYLTFIIIRVSSQFSFNLVKRFYFSCEVIYVWHNDIMHCITNFIIVLDA